MLHKTLSDCASSQSVVGGGRGVNQIIIYLAGPSSCHSRHNGEGGTGVVVCILGGKCRCSMAPDRGRGSDARFCVVCPYDRWWFVGLGGRMLFLLSIPTLYPKAKKIKLFWRARAKNGLLIYALH